MANLGGKIRREAGGHAGLSRPFGEASVKHVTTNNVTADQAIIADGVTTGGAARRNVASPVLLAASSGAPMPIVRREGLHRHQQPPGSRRPVRAARQGDAR